MGSEFKRQGRRYPLPFPCDFSVAHAFLWVGGEMVDLNTLISPPSDFKLLYATGITDAGEIVGNGVPAGVSPADWETLGHAIVLIPIHEDAANASVSTAAFSPGEVAVTATPTEVRKITEGIVAKIRAQQRLCLSRVRKCRAKTARP
jgi:hypothetical protein